MLWRHGRTEWNVSNRFQGRLDSPLTPDTLPDIAAAAGYLATLPPAVIAASPAQRALASAAYLEKESGLTARIDDGLQEVSLGAWEGLSHDEVKERYADEYAAWQRGDDIRRGGGESYAEVAARVSASLLRLADELSPGEVAVAVTHAGTARAAIGALLELPFSVWSTLGPLGNARWTVLAQGNRGWRLMEHNAGVVEPVVGSWLNAPDTEPVDSAESR